MSLRKGYAVEGRGLRSSRAAIRMSLIRRGARANVDDTQTRRRHPGRRGFREQCDKYTAVEKRRRPTEGTRTCARRDMIEHIQDK